MQLRRPGVITGPASRRLLSARQSLTETTATHPEQRPHGGQQVAKLPVAIKTKSGLQRFGGGSKLQQLTQGKTRRVSTIWGGVDGAKLCCTRSSAGSAGEKAAADSGAGAGSRFKCRFRSSVFGKCGEERQKTEAYPASSLTHPFQVCSNVVNVFPKVPVGG